MKHGQTTITAILFTVISLVVLLAFMPAIQSVINGALPGMDDASASLASLIPAIMVIGVILGFWLYVNPTRQPPQGGGY